MDPDAAWRGAALHGAAAHHGKTGFKGMAATLSLSLHPREVPLCIFVLPLKNSPGAHPLSSLPTRFSHTHVQLPSVIFVSKENLIQSISSASLPQCPPH